MKFAELYPMALTTDHRIHIEPNSILKYQILELPDKIIELENARKSRHSNVIYISLSQEELMITAFLSAYEGRENKTPSLIKTVGKIKVNFERVSSSDLLAIRHDERTNYRKRRELEPERAAKLYEAFLNTLLSVRKIEPDLSGITSNGLKGFNPLGTSIGRPMGGTRVYNRITR